MGLRLNCKLGLTVLFGVVNVVCVLIVVKHLKIQETAGFGSVFSCGMLSAYEEIGGDKMAFFRSGSWVFRYFASEASLFQFLFKGVLLFVVAQQIYFPQPNKYLHLVLVFVYMVFSDLLSLKIRSGKHDLLLLASAMGCSMLTVVDHQTLFNLEAAYLVMLVFEVWLTLALLFRLISLFNQSDDVSFIAGHHRAHAGKSLVFMQFLLWGMVCCLGVAVLYILNLLLFI